MKKKVNYFALSAGVLMIVVSFLNYLMNEDHVSLGIFVFLGSKEDRGLVFYLFHDLKAKRINKYAMTFFFIAFVIFIYWIAAGKLDIF